MKRTVSILLLGCALLALPAACGRQVPHAGTEDFLILRENVPNQAFYKDIFLDAGIGLTSRNTLYAAEAEGLTLDAMSFSRNGDVPEEFAQQNALIAGDADDTNGRLLYPDGQPRYRVLFVCGGSSKTHARSLNDTARAHMRAFVAAGGSYVGACAGGFFASRGYDAVDPYPYYLGLWPGVMQHTGLTNQYTDFSIEPRSALLRYSDFGGDKLVDRIRHNKGGYPTSLPAGTEVLARYVYPDKADVDGQVSAWAYKPGLRSGRVVIEGSHPEEVRGGEKQALTAALIRYAMDGVGAVSAKGFLHRGQPRVMDCTTEDGKPAYTRIGDLQCHHFAFYLPFGAKKISLETESGAACDLRLMLCRDTYAFPGNADHMAAAPGPAQRLAFDTLEPGIWYVAVQCLTTGEKYNGFPYSITVNWTER